MRVVRFAFIGILLSATCAQAQIVKPRPRHVTAPLDQLRKANAARPLPHQVTSQPFMYEPAGLAFDSSGNLYVAAPFLNEVLKVTTSGSLSIIAGTETAGYTGDGGPAVDAELDEPFGVAVDSTGIVYIADLANNVIREITTDGNIHTVAGGATAICTSGATDTFGDGCPATQATLSFPYEVAVDPSDNLLIADSFDSLVRRVNKSTQIITAVAGGATTICAGATDFVGDGCPATQAILEQPRGIAADTHGNIYIGDIDTATVRVVNSSGVISLYAGNFKFGFTANGVAATSTTLDDVENIALDSSGNLYISDATTNEIREVNATTHIISDVAGNIFGLDAYGGDGGPATSGTFEFVWGVAISPTNGQIYISDIDSNQIRFVNSDKTINTFVAPTLSEPQAFVEFEKQIVNTASNIVSVTLTNTSGAPITIASIDISNAVYTDDGNTCVDTNAPIPAGGTCQVNFTFTPTTVCDASSTNDATITISHDGPGGASFVFLSGYGAGTPGLTTDDLTDTDLSAAALAQQLVGSGVTISNVTYTGAPQAAGTFSGGQNIIGFDSGVILSNGAVSNVIGPNCSVGITADNGLPGDTDLQALLGPNAAATTDAAVLEFDFVPVGDTVNFQYVWSSDEYTEEVGAFDDVFAFFVNGSDAALVPGTNVPVSVNTINNGNSVDPSIPVSNPQYFIDNDIQYPSTAPLNTEMDGLTVVLSVTVPVNQGVSNHIKLAIADTGDHIYDSNVFLANGSINSSPLDLSVGTLAFGNQALNTTSPPQMVTITNAGSSTVDISSITASSNYADTTTCGETIAAQGTCTISVTFTPTATGFIQGVLNVTSNANGPNTVQSVSLSGTGVNPLTITLPASVTFPATPINTTSSPMAVTVLNNTSSVANLVITNAGSAAPFAISGGTCVNGQPGLAPGASCTYQLTFTPTTTTPSSGSFVLTDNATGSPQSVPLSGTTATQTVSVSVTPTTLTFPATPLNTASSPMSVTVKNTSTGGGTVSFTNISTSAPFAVTGGTCSTDSEPLPAGQSCTIAITFTPTGTSPSSGTLTIADNAGNSPQSVQLRGTTQSQAITVSVTPTSLTFPATPVNTTSSPMTVTVLNTSTSSTANVEFSSITATGPFAVSGGTCPVDLLVPGQTCAVNVTFTPTGTSPSSGTLTLSDNATGSPQTVSLSGTTKGAQTFTLSVGGNGSSTVDVSPGDTAIFPVVLTPGEGVTGVVNLTCTPSMPTITCTVKPTSITLTGSGAVDTGISVVTFCSWAPPGGAPTGPSNGPWRYAIPIASLLGMILALVVFTRTNRRRWLPAMAAVTFLAVGVAGCKNLPKGPDGRTPAGTYPITLTGTLNGQSQSLNFTLVVN